MRATRGAQLAGHVVLVTGAAGGIGRSVAEFVAHDGAGVMLADIDEQRAEVEAHALREKGLRAESARVDISDPESIHELVRQTLRRLGKIDGLVSCAGIDAPAGDAFAITEMEWRRVIDVDLTGQWLTAQALLQHMKAQGHGRIIFISSTAARRASAGVSVAYNAAKAGLLGLTIGLSAQVEPFGILVNAIAPGPTGTGAVMSARELEAYTAEHPLGIVGPQPVAHACLYLLRESGSWLSGTVLNVSGGRWRG